MRPLFSIVGAFAFIFSVFGLASPGMTALGQSMPQSAGQPGWSTYADPRFDFTIEYPADWYVHPRNDDLGGYGGTVIFSDLPTGEPGSRTRRAAVEIGFHLSEIEPDQSLSAWQDLYHTEARRDGSGSVRVVERSEISTPRWRGLLVRGSSSEGQFHAAEMPNGRVVWFIWSNCTGKELDIYHHMVRSLTFGPASPRDLREAYGEDFQPAPLEAPSPVVPAGADPGGPGPVELGFRLPFSGDKLISQGTKCVADENHEGVLSEAIDYSMPKYQQVKATFNGKVYSAKEEWAGGRVIRILHTASGYVSAYEHLDSINVQVDQTVAKGQLIGYSGETGNQCTGPHLHFDVRFYHNGPTAWIRTLPGTTWQSGDPRYPCPGRWCIDPPENKHCYYGHAVGP